MPKSPGEAEAGCRMREGVRPWGQLAGLSSGALWVVCAQTWVTDTRRLVGFRGQGCRGTQELWPWPQSARSYLGAEAGTEIDLCDPRVPGVGTAGPSQRQDPLGNGGWASQEGKPVLSEVESYREALIRPRALSERLRAGLNDPE